MGILETLIYSSYKFFGLTINMIAGLFGGTVVYNVALAYTSGCMAYFMYHNMEKRVALPGIDGTNKT